MSRRDSRPMTTDDEIRERIKAKKATKNAARYRGVLGKLLEQMKAGQTYPMGDIEVLIEKSGDSFTVAGGALTYGVREGYLNRVAWGRYMVTGKKLEG